MVIESRKGKYRQPVVVVTEMTDVGRWGCLGQQRKGFSFDPRKSEERFHTITWCMGSDHDVGATRENKMVNKATQESATSKGQL